MNQPPPPPPEGVLIEAARRDAKLSVREAARRAGISEGWWRQVVKGHQPTGDGSYILRRGPADTVAKMAAVARVAAERMETEGQRPDAAEAMRDASLREKPALAPRRFSLPEPIPEMARDLDPILAEVSACAMVAAAAYPGQRLTGRQVFPDSPAAPSYWPAARVFWDAAAAEGVRQEDIPDAVATLVAWKIQRDREQQQSGSAAGLGHRLPVRALL